MPAEVPRPVEMTLEIQFVLLLLLQQPDREMHTFRVAERLSMPLDTASSVLNHLAGAGWVTHRQEPDGEIHEHVYRLTADGVIMARQELAGRLTEVFTSLAGKLGLSVDVLHGADS